jgi:hypothetical protein
MKTCLAKVSVVDSPVPQRNRRPLALPAAVGEPPYVPVVMGDNGVPPHAAHLDGLVRGITP